MFTIFSISVVTDKLPTPPHPSKRYVPFATYPNARPMANALSLAARTTISLSLLGLLSHSLVSCVKVTHFLDNHLNKGRPFKQSDNGATSLLYWIPVRRCAKLDLSPSAVAKLTTIERHFLRSRWTTKEESNAEWLAFIRCPVANIFAAQNVW